MIRNLKTLGLALVAVFAFSAMAATAASAQQGELTSDGPVTLTISETGALGSNKLVAFGNETTCLGSTYTGHKYNVTPHELIPPGATTATITPHYKQLTAEGKINCKAAGLPATVTTNGCDFVFHVGGAVGGDTTTFTVTADVVCPAGKKIEVEAYTGEGEGILACRVTVGSVDSTGKAVNQGLSGPHLKHTNTGGADDIDISGIFKNVHAERHAGLCGGASTTNVGEFFIDATVTGHNSLKQPTAVTVTP